MFEQIAQIIAAAVARGSTETDHDHGWHEALDWLAGHLADHFKSENRFFDHHAFLKTCGFSVEPNWKAVPYNDQTQLANRFAVSTIVDGNGDIIADVFCQEAADLIETAPDLRRKLSEHEGRD